MHSLEMVSQKLGQPVMQFAGNALAFLDDGPLPQFAALLLLADVALEFVGHLVEGVS